MDVGEPIPQINLPENEPKATLHESERDFREEMYENLEKSGEIEKIRREELKTPQKVKELEANLLQTVWGGQAIPEKGVELDDDPDVVIDDESKKYPDIPTKPSEMREKYKRERPFWKAYNERQEAIRKFEQNLREKQAKKKWWQVGKL